MQKLLLKCGLAPGDIVMLTAAVRDLHKCYPNQFLTHVHTSCAELWENNPYITPLLEDESGVRVLDCSYPLINRSNEAPYHCLHGFMEFLNEQLGLCIRPSLFKGDIHLSAEEKSWYSQVYEVAGKDIPFWIVAAGGKPDITIKWWETRRYQHVIDYFRGRIQFVQVGQRGHHHPRLDGVIDLRGQTNLRQLVRLVYHAQGVLCSVTSLMHLAAAVEVKPGEPASRPCVVVAGGREPAHWEAYPGHQFIHTNGALHCCSDGGCWKDRTVALGDGDQRDQPGRLCTDVVGELPRCMDLITPEEVVRRIELYFHRGVINYLAPGHLDAAHRAVAATANNRFDRAPLTLQSARLACHDFIRNLPFYPDNCRGRGIVICGGGVKYFTNAWVCLNMLRHLGCALPAQLWYLGKREMDTAMMDLLAPLRVECVDARRVARQHPVRMLGGWQLKPYAILHSPFQEVLLLDADNVPVANPEYLFESEQFRQTGAVFWPDLSRQEKADLIWQSCGVDRPAGPEFESGQILADKRRCWRALALALWFNENSDFYYRHLYGDKETFHLAFEKLKQPYTLVDKPIQRLEGTMCQHDFEGNRLFQHRNTDKWNLFLHNREVEDFWYERECREYVAQLQQKWDGRARVCMASTPGKPGRVPASKWKRHALRIRACMISCPEREDLRRRTLLNLAATDWGEEPAFVQIDEGQLPTRQERQAHTTWLALRRSLQLNVDYLLFLEDDLDFNRHLRHNLQNWEPLQRGQVTLASLYNPDRPPLACDLQGHFMVVDGNSVYGSQAMLLSPATIAYILRHWNEIKGMQDIRISRLARRLRQPIFYHAPSLVQHIGEQSVWGGLFHQANDFSSQWRTEKA